MSVRLWSVTIDARDHRALGTWWAETLGWQVVESDDEDTFVQSAEGSWPALLTIAVHEPLVAKNRVHLDLTSQSIDHQAALVAALEARGAARLDVGQDGDEPWVVLADPEGHAFCVLEPREVYLGRGPIASVTLDAADPVALGAFYRDALGLAMDVHHDGWVTLRRRDGELPDIDLVAHDDPKQGKNRVHLDLAPMPGDSQRSEVNRLLDLGADHVDIGQGDQTWVVLADPEGNEFCVLTPR